MSPSFTETYKGCTTAVTESVGLHMIVLKTVLSLINTSVSTQRGIPMDLNSTTWKGNLRLCSDFFVTYYWDTAAQGVHFYSNIAVAATNVLLSLFGMSANTILLLSYAKSNRLRGVSHLLLATLASSDLLVTAVAQPLFVTRTLMEVRGTVHCLLWMLVRLAIYFCCGVSILTITVMTLERFITLAYPFQRNVILTSAHIKTTMVSTWSITFLVVLSHVYFLPYKVFLTLGATLLLICILIIISIWIWIHRLLRRHRSKIEVTQTPANSPSGTFQRKRVFRNTRTSYVIVAAVLLCYLPVLLTLGYFSTRPTNFVLIFVVEPWPETLMFANSLLNPLLVFWQQRDFKDAIKGLRFCRRA